MADIRSPVPEFMRAKAPEPAPLEAPPDIKLMLRDNGPDGWLISDVESPHDSLRMFLDQFRR